MRALVPSAASRLAQQRGSAGFTLVELMVAMTGGLFLSIVVFALSRDASRFYQSESRIANATLAGVSGFERLSNDVARAGHMSTPNINADPRVCNRPDGNFPLMLQSLRALIINAEDTSAAGTEVEAAGIKPQSIIISGALSTAEVLTTRSVAEEADGWQISVNLATPAAARVGLSPADSATNDNEARLRSIFMAGDKGRIVRLRSKGLDLYAVVKDVAASTGLGLVNLDGKPKLFRIQSGGTQCGIDGQAKDMDISVIDLVRYDIRPMINDSAYAALFKASGLGTSGGPGALPYEATRAELVRVELTPENEEIAATREIVGEYAVDLQLSAWRASASTNPALVPTTGEVLDEGYPSTQLLRGVHVRFSVRSREADRDRGISGGVNDHYRIPLGASKGPPFARVRTFQSYIALRNLEGSQW
jgi:hypothetical protein